MDFLSNNITKANAPGKKNPNRTHLEKHRKLCVYSVTLVGV